VNLRHLRSFLWVAEHGSLSRASAATDQPQSLISRQVAALEADWGDRLFVRTGRGMTLSDFGRRMLPEVRTAMEQISRLDNVVREAAGVPVGTVHLGVLPSLARLLLPLLFSDLRATAPAVTLHAAEDCAVVLLRKEAFRNNPKEIDVQPNCQQQQDKSDRRVPEDEGETALVLFEHPIK